MFRKQDLSCISTTFDNHVAEVAYYELVVAISLNFDEYDSDSHLETDSTCLLTRHKPILFKLKTVRCVVTVAIINC